MKRLVLILIAIGALATAANAGTETYSGREMKQIAPGPAPCPEWYFDNEWNVSLWGAYAFTGTENDKNSLFGTFVTLNEGRFDRFLGDDHAWGGGIDAKYFWRRYFGFGLEGFGLDGRYPRYVIEDFGATHFREGVNHAVGAVLGTFTLRYPIPCTRFSPYVWAGGGGIFGGRNEHVVVTNGAVERIDHETESRGMGQFGGGLEVRITPHIGWIADFSWNVIEGPTNNFGMARTGVNFAF
jgi:opacity protein-like surface antigen